LPLWTAVKPAVTFWLALKVMVHVVAVPLQAPPHPENPIELPGVAVSVTWVPLWKFAVQVVGQLIPEGELVMVPDPVPLAATVSCTPFWTGDAATPRHPIAKLRASRETSSKSRRIRGTGAHSMELP
jgi:hypothetical protein